METEGLTFGRLNVAFNNGQWVCRLGNGWDIAVFTYQVGTGTTDRHSLRMRGRYGGTWYNLDTQVEALMPEAEEYNWNLLHAVLAADPSNDDRFGLAVVLTTGGGGIDAGAEPALILYWKLEVPARTPATLASVDSAWVGVAASGIAYPQSPSLTFSTTGMPVIACHGEDPDGTGRLAVEVWWKASDEPVDPWARAAGWDYATLTGSSTANEELASVAIGDTGLVVVWRASASGVGTIYAWSAGVRFSTRNGYATMTVDAGSAVTEAIAGTSVGENLRYDPSVAWIVDDEFVACYHGRVSGGVGAFASVLYGGAWATSERISGTDDQLYNFFARVAGGDRVLAVVWESADGDDRDVPKNLSTTNALATGWDRTITDADADGAIGDSDRDFAIFPSVAFGPVRATNDQEGLAVWVAHDGSAQAPTDLVFRARVVTA